MNFLIDFLYVELRLVELESMMWYAASTLLFTAVIGTASVIKDIPNSEILLSPNETETAEIIAQYDKITDEFLASFAAVHGAEELKRKKRQLMSQSTASLSDETGVYRLKSLNPILATCSPQVQIEFIDIQNLTWAVCISAQTEEAPAIAHLGYISNGQWVVKKSWFLRSPEDVAIFHDKEMLFILVADREIANGIVLARYNMTTNNDVVDDHTVHGKYPTAVSIWKMKNDGLYHMAVANSGGNPEAEDLSTEIYIYHWLGTYFDKYTQVVAYDVTDIEPFHIHGAAYLAVANFRRGSQDYFVDSEIFKYSLDQGTWISHQKIRTYGAMDWQFFSLGEGGGQEFFLVVANYAESSTNSLRTDVNSVIYKFVKDIFVPFQCLQTYGATSVSAISMDKKFLLAIANYDGVFLYQYDGWRFVRARVQYTESTMSSGVRALSFHHFSAGAQPTLILGVSNTRSQYMYDSSVYEIEFVNEKNLQRWHDKSTEWCLSKLDAVDGSAADKPFQGLKNLFFVDQRDPIIINGNLVFDGGMEASKLSTPELLDTSSGQVYDNSVLSKLEELSRRLQLVRDRIENINSLLARALKLNGTQKITAKYEFRDVSFLCESKVCHFENVNTTMLNGEDVTDLKNKVIFTDQDQIIPFPLAVENVQSVSIDVGGLVDGVDIKNLVTKSGNHEITGPKQFTNAIHANDVKVDGLVNGIKFGQDTILLRTGAQNITGNLEFADVDVEWLEVGFLNNVHLDSFYQDVVLNGSTAVITGTKIFQDIVVNNLEMSEGSKINDIDLRDLWENAVFIDRFQEIAAPMSFLSMNLGKNLQLDGTLNGIHIPGPEIVLLNDSKVFHLPQTFMKDTYFNKLHVTRSLNGIAVDEAGNLDILLKTGHQVITGQKTFKSLFLGGQSFVGGTVDGVDLSVFREISIHRDTPVTTSQPWTFNNLVVKGPLFVGGKISGLDLEDIYDRALKIDGTDNVNFDNFVFKKLVRVDNLITDNINGVDVSKDLVRTNGSQVVTGIKTFYDVVLEDDATVRGLVNNIDLNFLQDTLLKVGDQIITSDKVIQGNLRVEHLIVNGNINGIAFDDALRLDDESLITGIKTFHNVTFGNLYVDHLDIGGLVNNIDIIDMMKDTLTYDGNQIVTGTKMTNGNINIPSDSNIQTNSLNGIDLSALYSDAVLVNEPQEISGHKIFQAPVAFDDLWVQGSVDGVTEWDMKYNWMLNNVNQTVTGNIEFSEMLTAGNVFVDGLINEVDITKLNSSIVKINEPAVIEGPIVFEDSVISNGDITLTGKVQGIDLSEEAVVKSTENVITGHKVFASDLRIDGDLTVSGLIDNVMVDDICQNTVLLDQDQTLDHLTVEGDVTFKEGGTVGGKLAGVDIAELYKNSVNSFDKETFVSGYKMFENLTIEGNLIVKGKFGGVDIDDLLNNYMSLTRDQRILAPMRFQQVRVDGALYSNNMNTGDQKVNGIDLQQLDERLLKVNGHQIVDALYTFNDLIFEEDLFVAGKVNGIEIPKGVMRRDKANYINSPKIFTQNVKVLGDLSMEDGKTIQGVDVSAWSSKVVRNYGSFHIQGLKTFTEIRATDVVVDGLIDGVKVSDKDLLMTYGDQVVTGKKTILNDVDIEGHLAVGGLINDTDFADLERRAVRKDRKNVITGLKTFKQPLTVMNLEAQIVDGVDIEDLARRVHSNIDIEPLKLRLEEMDDAVSEIQTALNNQAILLQYYELFQSFEIPGAYLWLYFPTSDSEFLLLSDFTQKDGGCTTIRIFEFDDSDEIFRISSQELVSSSAVAMKFLDAWGFKLLVIANSKAKPQCVGDNPQVSTETGYGMTPSSVYIFEPENSTFLPYQNIMTSPVADLAVFVDENVVCLLYLELYDSVLYCARDMLHDFVLHEKLRTKGGRKATIVQSENRTMLAITSVDVLNPSFQQSVDIYYWDSSTKTFGDPVQVIQNMYAESVLFMTHTIGYITETFLILAEGQVPRINNIPRLFIYKKERNGFQEYQEVKDYGELDWVTLATGDLIFFALDRRSGEVKVYQHKGASGFVRIDTFSSVGAVTLHAFERNIPGDKNHYLALAGFQSRIPNMWYDPENAKILKSKMKGTSPKEFY